MKRFFDALAALGLSDRPGLFVPKVTGRVGNPTRPLNSDQLDSVHAHAYHWLQTTRRLLTVAFSEAGGSALGVASVRLEDLDLGRGTVAFRGSAARTNPLASHAIPVVRAALNEGAALGVWFVVTGGLDDVRAKWSATQESNQVNSHATVRRRSGVAGRSILLAAALEVLDADGLDAVARFLGAESLETTAASLGYDWRQR